MTKLNRLRSHLAALRRRRGFVRILTALCAVLIALVWILGAIFLIDFLLERHVGVAARLFLMVLGTAGLGWVFLRFAAPWLGISESSVDMALLVERQQQIDSDLVAAMQFESPQARRWGSAQLEDAVIDYVGQFSRGLNVFAGMDYSTMGRRGLLATVTVLLAVAVVAIFPAHAKVFLARLVLLPEHYPTDTIIETIEINGKSVPVSPYDRTVVHVGYGQPVVFAACCSGEIPDAGEVQLRSVASGKRNPVELNQAGPRENAIVFRGKLERLLDTVNYKLYLGDAWTDAREISLIPLPVIEPQFKVIPPGYAQAAADALPDDPSVLQLAVLESSRIEVVFESMNKPLQRADLVVEVGTETFPYELVQVDEKNKRKWGLPTPEPGEANTPFERVEQPIRFTLQVTDEDDLQLETPLKGYVRLKADRRPQVMGDMVHRVVLPGAKPVIELRASDDYGIAELALDVQILRTREKSGMEGMSTQSVEQKRLLVSSLLEPTNGRPGAAADGGTRQAISLEFPAFGDVLPIVGGYRLDLAAFELVKGDQLRLTLEATDYRGKLPGRLAQSEPLILDISDESGVLAAISEADETSEARITDLIRRQLGIGESP